MCFCMATWKLNIGKRHNYVTWTWKTFIVYIETEDIYVYIVKHSSNYELDRSLPIGKNKKVIGLMKNYLVWHNIARICCMETKSI